MIAVSVELSLLWPRTRVELGKEEVRAEVELEVEVELGSSREKRSLQDEVASA